MNLNLLAQAAGAAPPGFWESHGMEVLGLWVGIGLTLAVYTFLYKDNPVFKFAEHLYVGVSNGYLIWQAWYSSIKPQLCLPLWRATQNLFHVKLAEPLGPNENFWLLVPAIFSLFMLLRFYSKAAWLSRWSFAFFVGTTAGTAIPLTIQAQLFKQFEPMLTNPVARQDGHILFMGTLNQFLIIAGVTATLVYFLFSVEHKGPVKHVARVGILFIMIAFGASFGYTVMARESLLIGRVKLLINGARGTIPEEQGVSPHHATIWLLFAVIALVAVLEILQKKKEGQAEAKTPGA